MSGGYPHGPSSDWKRPGSPFYSGWCCVCSLSTEDCVCGDACSECGEVECVCEVYQRCGPCEGRGTFLEWDDVLATYTHVDCGSCGGEGRVRKEEAAE